MDGWSSLHQGLCLGLHLPVRLSTWISQREPWSFLEAALCCMGLSKKESPRNVIWALWQQGGPVSVNWTPNLSSEAYLLTVHKGCVWSTSSWCQSPFDLCYVLSEESHHALSTFSPIVYGLQYPIIPDLQVGMGSLGTKDMQWDG